jgi:sodium/potassium-transporting ATPase subunit alpha
VPACNVFFSNSNEPLAPWQLALSLPFAALILLGDELRRYFVRHENPFVLKWLKW